MPAQHERRFAIDGWQSVDFNVRAVEDGDGMTFEGYAAVFNQDSDGPIPGFGVEQIAPGAFSRSLKSKRDIKMFLNHNSDLVLASRNAGTLELSEDDHGLMAKARLIDTTAGLDTAKNVKAGNVSKMSFGFTPEQFKARTDDVEGIVHTRVQLWEVSPVTSWPAYAGTSAGVRHLAEVAELDEEPLKEAIEILLAADALLDLEQRNLLLAAINARTDAHLIAPETAAILSVVRDHEAELAAVGKRLGLA
jgi:HK97 family phage prohead protease